MTQKAKSVAAIAGQFCCMFDPGEVMADEEALTFKRPNLFQWQTIKIYRWVLSHARSTARAGA